MSASNPLFLTISLIVAGLLFYVHHFYYPAALLIILLFVAAIWWRSVKVEDTSIMDIYWGPGFALTAWTYFGLATIGGLVPDWFDDNLTDGYLPRKLLFAGLVTIWAARLGFYIYIRNRGKPEDPRYQAWRREHGRSYWWKSFFRVFLLQGYLMWVISCCFLLPMARSQPAELVWTDYLGLGIWLIGFYFEAMGDYQLRKFKKNPQNKGKVLDTGLWRYTRHPNYFGEVVMWWGYYCIISSTDNSFAYILCPLLMTFLIVKVSGVTLLEDNLVDTKPQYREYIETTSAFIPWFPKKKKTY